MEQNEVGRSRIKSVDCVVKDEDEDVDVDTVDAVGGDIVGIEAAAVYGLIDVKVNVVLGGFQKWPVLTR